MGIVTGAVAAPATTSEARGRTAGDGVTLGYGFWPGRGPTVVGIHGITASYANFVGVADRLAGRRPLLALDLRGRGASDKPDGPYGMAQHARDVAAAMASFGLNRSVIVGHSMGAFVAVALANEHPELVAGLVLVDGGLPLQAPEGVVIEDMLDVLLAPAMARLRQTFASFDDYTDYWRAQPTFADGRWNSWVDAYLRYDLGGTAPTMQPKASEAAVRADFLDTTRTDVLRGRIANLQVPVALLRAEQGFQPGDSPLLPDELVKAEAAPIADLTDRVIGGTTHYTIALGDPGATEVADAVAAMADRCGR